jgi:hypothetical protein
MTKSRQLITLLFTFGVAFLSVPAVSSLVFGVVGRVPEESGWFGTVALFIGLVASTAALAASLFHPRKSLISRILMTISAALSGAWLGFYYSEVMSGFENQPVSLVIAVIVALLMAALGFYLQIRLVTIVILVLGIVAAYGLAFMCSTATFAFLSTNHFVEGILWGVFSLMVIGSIVVFLTKLTKEVLAFTIN